MTDELKQAEMTELRQELDRLTPARRVFLLGIAAGLVAVWRVGGFKRFLVVLVLLVALVRVMAVTLPAFNDWLERAVIWLDEKLNGKESE